MADVRENDLVLAQNEYAFVRNTNDGTIITHVGPTKATLTGTDQPMKFDEKTSQFVCCSTKECIKQMIYADERSYVVLQNPYYKNIGDQLTVSFPAGNTSNTPVKLEQGKSINIQGPCSFPLWPGQVAKTIPGHQLRTNQYLLVQVVNAEEAKKNWEKSTIETVETKKNEAKSKTQTEFKFVTGRLNIIRGNEISFYIPPTGVEVVYDHESNSYQRDALTLETLFYCILKDESGDKEYVKGPAVVFPKPTQTFVTTGKSSENKKFKSLELNKDMGVYIKVICSYEDPNGHEFVNVEGKKVVGYEAGEELFITGEQQKIYFPRPEHAIIKYDNQVIHYAIVIPEGEARYVLNRTTGTIDTIKGPIMYLPDPRFTTIVKRVLDTKTAELWFPGNTEVRDHNLAAANENKNELGFIETDRSAKATRNSVAGDYSMSTLKFFDSPNGGLEDFALLQDAMSRKSTFTPPRSIKINTKYDGAVLINVWPGYAIQLVSRSGQRSVICGPKAVILDYNQTLEVLTISAGNPKGSKAPVQTTYLNIKNNKVSDIIDAETKDLVPVKLSVSYKVNFEDKDCDKWFNIQDYTKFLTEHLRSVIRNSVKKFGIEEFYAKSIDIIRDTILGEKVKDKERTGKYFSENGMRVYDIEILNVSINNPEISKLLINAQHHAVECTLTVTREEADLFVVKRLETVKQNKLDIIEQTKDKMLAIELKNFENSKTVEKIKAEIEESKVEFKDKLAQIEFERNKLQDSQEIFKIGEKTKIATEAHEKRMAAISEKLIAAINNLGDKQLAMAFAENLPKATGTNGYLFGTGGNEGLLKLITGNELLESKIKQHVGKTITRDGEGLINE